MKLTQQDGARLMAAHAKVLDAHRKYMTAAAYPVVVYEAAEQRFAALVASLTDSEGL
jgi:hypothetical protein